MIAAMAIALAMGCEVLDFLLKMIDDKIGSRH